MRKVFFHFSRDICMSGNTQDDADYEAKAEHTTNDGDENKTEIAQAKSDEPPNARRRWKLVKNMLVAFKTDEPLVSYATSKKYYNSARFKQVNS
jgi:hypothetical protein